MVGLNLMDKREIIATATSGSGLYLFDNEFDHKWKNMDVERKLDWQLFFDMMREQSTSHNTELIINAIENGLCPQSGYELTTEKGKLPDIWAGPPIVKKFWYFLSNRDNKFTNDSLPEHFEPSHKAVIYHGYGYHNKEKWIIAPAIDLDTDREVSQKMNSWRRHTRTGRTNSKLISLWKFKHPFNAWAFLLKLM